MRSHCKKITNLPIANSGWYFSIPNLASDQQGKQPGVNFTIILWAAFAHVDLLWTYWHMAQSIQHKSWTYLQVLCTSRVRCSFVVEIEQHLFAPNAVCWRICALHQWVGEIDPRTTTRLTVDNQKSAKWQIRTVIFLQWSEVKGGKARLRINVKQKQST